MFCAQATSRENAIPSRTESAIPATIKLAAVTLRDHRAGLTVW